MDLIDEQDRIGVRFQFLDDLLQALLEIAAITRAGEQRAHVEREHGRCGQHLRYFAIDDALGKPFRDCSLANAGFADEQRVVLLAAAQHLDGAIDLGIAANDRIDLAVARLLVEIDAIGIERLALLLRILAALGVGFLIDAAHRPRLGYAGSLRDAVADVVHRVIAGHVLLLQEVRRMALALREDRNQHIGTGDFLAPRGLNVNHGTLHDALESGSGLRIVGPVRNQVLEFGFKIIDETAAQLVEIDAASAHHRGSV